MTVRQKPVAISAWRTISMRMNSSGSSTSSRITAQNTPITGSAGRIAST